MFTSPFTADLDLWLVPFGVVQLVLGVFNSWKTGGSVEVGPGVEVSQKGTGAKWNFGHVPLSLSLYQQDEH